MRINSIELYNIGSYEGRNCFDISAQGRDGKIVLIGGKNGAGKTTLFTSIKLCLYGYKESGYQAMNAYYKRQIKKLINDKAKIENHGNAFVALSLNIHNGQEWDEFFIKRRWSLKDDNFERFSVWKNDVEMSVEEISDFENYLLNLIPPELFELYFFDGEQIADFFLENSGNTRVKKAFLTLCGYDTFDILYKNFKRINKSNNSEDDILAKYLEAEDRLYLAEKRCREYSKEIEEVINEIETKTSELKELEQRYALRGGVSISEWNDKFLELKNEERLREEKNAWLKTAANDIIPYIIIQTELRELLEKMDWEREQEQFSAAKEVLKSVLPDVLKELGQESDLNLKICELVAQRLNSSPENDLVLKLSREEYNKLSAVINILLSHRKEDIIKVRNDIKRSLNRSKKIRDIIENSSIEGIDTFLSEKEALLEKREELTISKESLNDEYALAVKQKEEAEQSYKRISKELDQQLKSQSVNDLSVKAIVFLEELQRRLFSSEIEKVQSLFMSKMSQLMRKKQFIDNIKIDEDFNIHVYKKVLLDCHKVSKKIRIMSPEGYQKEYGEMHCNDILKASKCENLKEFAMKYYNNQNTLEVMLEFDKSTMSKGEKQVFIMSLYWAMMKLCNKEIPFIIDTPFARIDTEHRAHITEFFFKELSGQVFIFSTNEEITKEHVEVIGNDLQATFLIENVDNKKTSIEANKYFGEK